MQLKITTQTEGALLKRKHIIGQLDFPGEKTPSNKDVSAAIAKATGANEDAIAVRRIEMSFGATTAAVDAYVYESKEILLKTEARPKPKTAANPAEAK